MKLKIDFAASGIKYEEAEELINCIAGQKARQYRKIGFLDDMDLEQEVRVKCWQALPKYDHTCSNLKVFLSVCADNRLRDIKRSILYKHNKPCFKCPFWDIMAAQSGFHDCIAYKEKMECEKYSKHEKYVQVKLSASHPIDINSQKVIDHKYEKKIEGLDFVEYVYSVLPSAMWIHFDKVKNNNFNVKVLRKKDRTMFVSAMRIALQDYKGV